MNNIEKSFENLFSSRIKYQIPLLILALCGTALVFFSTRNYGPGVSTDSVKYIAAARNWIAGNGLYSFDNTPLTLWPPLYPLGLGVTALLFQRDPASVAYLLNAVVFGLTVYSAGVYFRRTIPGAPLIGFFGTIAFLFSIPLLSVSLWVWSEPLFYLFLILSFICMDWYLENRSFLALLSLATCAALGALSRYLGVTLILWGGLVLTLKLDNFGYKVRDTSLFLVTSSLPLAAWVLRNYQLTGLPMGSRNPSSFTVGEVISTTWVTVSSWFFPAGKPWHNVALWVAIITITAAAWFCHRDLRRIAKSYLSAQWPMLLNAVVFVLFMLASTFLSQPDINSRMLSPLYIPLLILAVQGLAALIIPLQNRYPSLILHSSLSLLFVAWMFYIVSAGSSKEVISLMTVGGGFNTRESRENDVAHYIKWNKLAQTCKIYTNFPEGVYFLGNNPSSMTLSKKTYNLLIEESRKAGQPVSWPPEEKACLAWFDDRITPGLVPAADLQKILQLDVIKAFKYGTIYSISREIQ